LAVCHNAIITKEIRKGKCFLPYSVRKMVVLFKVYSNMHRKIENASDLLCLQAEMTSV